jgi:anti-sigma factor RsiW
MQVEDLLGAYALDALDENEKSLVDQHLSTCSSCYDEVIGHREVAAMLAGPPIPPPDRVWDRILVEIAPVAPDDEIAPVVPLRRSEGRFGNVTTRWMAGAAAAVAVVALGVAVIAQSGRIGALNDQVTAQQQEIASLASALQTDPLQRAVAAALEDPDALIANLTAENTSASMQIVVLPDGTGYIHSDTLVALPDDATYQLWAVVDERVISAGILGNDPDLLAFHVDVEGLQGFVITEEVAGGVAQSEADPVVAWFEA